jgi:hypothetical protein
MINPDLLLALGGLVLAGTALSGLLLWRLDLRLRGEQPHPDQTPVPARAGDLQPAASRV